MQMTVFCWFVKWKKPPVFLEALCNHLPMECTPLISTDLCSNYTIVCFIIAKKPRHEPLPILSCITQKTKKILFEIRVTHVTIVSLHFTVNYTLVFNLAIQSRFYDHHNVVKTIHNKIHTRLQVVSACCVLQLECMTKVINYALGTYFIYNITTELSYNCTWL